MKASVGISGRRFHLRREIVLIITTCISGGFLCIIEGESEFFVCGGRESLYLRKGDHMKTGIRYLMLSVLLGLGLFLSAGAVRAESVTLPLNSDGSVTATYDVGEQTININGDGTIHREIWRTVMNQFGIMDNHGRYFNENSVREKIKSMTIGETVYLPENSERLFENFRADLFLKNPNQGGFTNVTRMFANAGEYVRDKYVYADFSEWGMYGVESFREMFLGASIDTLDVSRWNTSCATDAEGMFRQMRFQMTFNLGSYPGCDVEDETVRARLRNQFDSSDLNGAWVEWCDENGEWHETQTDYFINVADLDTDTELIARGGIRIGESGVRLNYYKNELLMFGEGSITRDDFLDVKAHRDFAEVVPEGERTWSVEGTAKADFRVKTMPGKSITFTHRCKPFNKFYGRVHLEGNLNMGPRNNMDYFFEGNQWITGLQNLNLNGIDELHGTFKGATLSDASGLDEWDLSSVNSIHVAFEGAVIEGNTYHVNFPEVTQARGAFKDAKVPGDAVSSWKFPRLQNAGFMFRGADITGCLSMMDWGCDWGHIDVQDAMLTNAIYDELKYPFDISETGDFKAYAERLANPRQYPVYRAAVDERNHVVSLESFPFGPMSGSAAIPNTKKGMIHIARLGNEGWFKLYDQEAYLEYSRFLVGQHKIDGLLYYFDDMRKGRITGWYEAEGKRYHADENHILSQGRTEIDGKWYFFGRQNPWLMKYRGFRKIGDHYYHFDKDYSLHVGWLQRGDKRYYMNGNGQRVSGFRFIGSKLYFFGGVSDPYWRQNRGFHKIGNEYYHYDKDHSLHRGWLTRKEGKYYMDGKGRRMYGFRFVKGKLYYFGGKTDGKLRQLRGFRKIGKHYYHYDADHSLHRGWLTRGDKRYYMSGKGVRAYGIWKVGDKRYYFGDEKTGYLRKYTGWKTINGKKYYFNKDHSIR